MSERNPDSSGLETDGKQGLDQRLCDAVRQKDLDAAMACFWDNPDLVVVLNGDVFRGIEAVGAAFKSMFENHESIDVEVNEVSHVQSGDTILGVGTATYTMTPKQGKSKLVVERWSDLRRKVDGKWVFVLDHTTHLPH